MYEFVDRPVTSLDRGGCLLIWSMRRWVGALHSSQCPCSSVGPAFVRHDVTRAIVPFHNIMMILNRDALEHLHFGPLACSRIHEHEALILSLIGAVQMSRPETVKATLNMIVPEQSVSALVEAFVSLSRILLDAMLLPGLSDPA